MGKKGSEKFALKAGADTAAKKPWWEVQQRVRSKAMKEQGLLFSLLPSSTYSKRGSPE